MSNTPQPKRSFKDSLQVLGPAVLITIIGLVVAYQFVEPAPPREISLATGRADGAYHAFGLKLKEILAESEITVTLVPSAGSLDNLGKLRGNEVDLAFAQGGTGELGVSKDPAADEKSDDSKEAAPEAVLHAIASLYYEPLWLFHRADADIELISDLKDLRVSVGPDGSGTRAIAQTLLTENGVDSEKLDARSGSEAARALIAGELDAVFLVASPKAESVSSLLHAEKITLFDCARADAYPRRHRYLSSITLPRGVVDPAEDIPHETKRLLAPTAQLVTQDSFHPALVDLILDAANRVFAEGDLLQETPAFPSAESVDYPLSPISKRYFKSGRPFLYRYLPFLVAAFIDRIKILILPLLTLLLPLIKVIPPVLRWRTRSKIYRWYRDLLTIEEKAKTTPSSESLAALGQLESDVAKISVPPSYSDELFHLKAHLQLVRERVEAAQPSTE